MSVEGGCPSEGICLRTFPALGFVGIVFCAMAVEELMKSSDVHQTNFWMGIVLFLTFTDSFTIEYFKKQRFSKDFKLSKSVCQGYLKDNEKAMRKHSEAYPRIVYAGFSAVAQTPKECCRLSRNMWKCIKGSA